LRGHDLRSSRPPPNEAWAIQVRDSDAGPDSSDRLRPETWLDLLPLIKGVYVSWQYVHQLYDRELTPGMAETLPNNAMDSLSAEARRCASDFIELTAQ